MKKLILVFAAVALTAGVFAQNDSKNKNLNQQDKNYKQDQTVNKSHVDGFMMQNGKMMQVKAGQTTLLNSDMTLSNGTKILTDGTCIRKDGSKTTFKEGQHIDMTGKMVTNKDKDMYLLQDSTRNN